MKTLKARKVKVDKVVIDLPLIETYESAWNAIAETPEQAANLRARSELMRQIAAIVKDSGWTQLEAEIWKPTIWRAAMSCGLSTR